MGQSNIVSLSEWSLVSIVSPVQSVQCPVHTIHSALCPSQDEAQLDNVIEFVDLYHGDGYSSNSIRKPNMDVGQFPFKRGERPIFNFDQGDEGFIGTIPELIEGLDKIKNVMNQQRRITQAFGEAFDQCEACG